MTKPKTSTPRLLDRPVTMKSGVALQSNYSVQHRSDILMEEQIAAVKTAQEALKKALSDLESAKSDEEIDTCRVAVQEAKEKSEKAVLVLAVLNKVNTELTFARAELDEALDHQEGDINEARKRVMWLEDRMGLLCGKVRVRGQPVNKQRSKSHRTSERDDQTYRSRLGSYSSDKSSEDGAVQSGRGRMGKDMSMEFVSDTTRRGGRAYTPSDSGSEYPYAPPARPGMLNTPSSEGSYGMPQQMGMAGGMQGPGMMRGPGMDDSDSDSDSGMPHGMPGMPLGMPGVPGMPPSMGMQPGMSQRGMSASTQSSEKTEGVMTATTSQPGSLGAIQIPFPTSEPSETQDTPAVSVRFDQETLGSKTDETGQGQEEEEEEEEPHKEEVQQEGREDEDQEDGDQEQTAGQPTDALAGEMGQLKALDIGHETFMTEVSAVKSVTIVSPKREDTRQGRRVTFQDSEYLQDEEEDEDEETPREEDRARDYWKSEHHRFEYSEFSEVLCEIDPLSYHAVGLAIPGTFIKKNEKGYMELPWRQRRKGSDIQDIHKIALDKLALKLHNMYDKVYDAAMLSVRGSHNQDQLHRRDTMFSTAYDMSSREAARTGTPTMDKPGMVTAPPTTADAMSRPATVSTEVLPRKVKVIHNVYYPKPIPPPEMLPLTRTSKDKTYPQSADCFGDTTNPKRRPAVRVVDQRNLQQETQLKLFKERPKQKDEGPSSMEKKFRMMLEREKSSASRSSHSSRLSSEKTATKQSLSRTITKDENGDQVSTWSRLKPNSRSKEYSGLKWERVKTMVHVNLVSSRPEERRDAAKHLGLLRCGDAMVFYALKERLKVDEDSRVRYEVAKALILLGCWDEDVLQITLKFLVMGNSEIRQDLILNMIDGKNVQYVNKSTPTFPELVKVLSHFCRNPDPEEPIAFDAAVLLGRLCVADENAKFKLLRTLDQTFDTHIKAKALEVLVKQLSCTNWEVVEHLLDLFTHSHVWKYRALAADLLIILGKSNVCKPGEEERIYAILERKLWDDPTRDVRVSAAKALTALGMFSKACERIEKRLEDPDEDIRTQAVISVGTLEMKNEKIIRLLLEMLELDSSEYVRLMIARTFTILKLTDKRVLRALRERDKVEGPLARESRKALKILEAMAMQSRALSSPMGRRSVLTRSGTPKSRRLTPAVTV